MDERVRNAQANVHNSELGTKFGAQWFFGILRYFWFTVSGNLWEGHEMECAPHRCWSLHMRSFNIYAFAYAQAF